MRPLRALVPLLAAAVVTAGCSGPDPSALPTPLAPQASPPASPSPPPSSTPVTPITPGTSTASGTLLPSPTLSASPDATPSAPPAPTVASLGGDLAVVLQQQVVLVSAAAGAVADSDQAAAEGWAAELSGRNAEAIGALTASIYPDEETAAVVALVRESVPQLLEYARGTAPAGDPAVARGARERLEALVEKAAVLLEEVTGLPTDDGEEALSDHLAALLGLVDARLAGDEGAAYEQQREAVAGVDGLVRPVVETVGVQQGYSDGGGVVLDVSPPATAAAVRAALPSLLAEQAGLLAQATDAAVRDQGGELAAARAALGPGEGGVGGDLAAAVGAVYGPAVQEAFGDVLGARTDLLIRLGQASAPGADPASRDRLAAEVATSGRTLATVLAELTDGALPVEVIGLLVAEQLDAQVAAVAARAAGDARGAATVAGLAAERAALIGARVAEAIVVSRGLE